MFNWHSTQQREFEALLRPHMSHLYRLAIRFCKHKEDAEDLVQDVLIKLYPKYNELKSIAALRPYLAKTVYRSFIDSLRADKRNPLSLVDNEFRESMFESEDNVSFEKEADLRQLKEELLHIFERLPAEQRVVLAMHDMEGYSLNNLEKMLDIPLGTLKSRLQRGRTALRALLEQEPFLATFSVYISEGSGERK